MNIKQMSDNELLREIVDSENQLANLRAELAAREESLLGELQLTKFPKLPNTTSMMARSKLFYVRLPLSWERSEHFAGVDDDGRLLVDCHRHGSTRGTVPDSWGNVFCTRCMKEGYDDTVHRKEPDSGK